MKDEEINALLICLDGRGADSEFNAVAKLRESLGDRFPLYVLQHFRHAKTWKARTSCVYHVMGYSKRVREAFDLGMEALFDKSKVVRYRACMLLAFAQNKEALPALKNAAEKFQDHADILAAIDAIENHNHHYFQDRDHSGKVKMNITEF